MTRPSWDATWLAVAQQVAKRSLCSRAQVGAVIVTADNRVIATGYNGPPAGWTPELYRNGFRRDWLLRVDKPSCEHWCERGKPATDPYTHLPEPFRSDPTWTDPKLREFYHAPSLSGQLWPGGPALSPTYDDCPSLHAEANALMAADRSTWQGGTLYVTGSCCYSCAKLVANSGLKRVVLLEEDVDRSYRRPEAVEDFLVACGLEVLSLKSMTTKENE